MSISDSAGSFVRSTQTLPIPLAGLAPEHRHPTALRRALHRYRSAPLLAVALVAALSGIWLSITPLKLEAGLARGVVEVDGVALPLTTEPRQDTRVFVGAATLVISTAPAGIVRAGAVMTWNGTPTTGRCVLRPGGSGASETCDFVIGDARLTATDRYSERSRTWTRRYGDGRQVAIKVPDGDTLIPVPFPLGH